MYPHRKITKAAVAELPPRDAPNVVPSQKVGRDLLTKMSVDETKRIQSINQENMLQIELDEASQKWTNAYEQVKTGQDTPGLTLNQARFEMGLASHRYWTALAQLNRVLDKTRLITRVQFWLLVVGGFLIALVGTVYTVLSYYKQ